MNPEFDSYYCMYNSKLMDDFIHSHNEMYHSMNLHIQFLLSKVLILESELKELKKNENK